MMYAGNRMSSTGEVAVLPTTQQPPPVLPAPPAPENWPRWGVTHTQFSADNEPRDVAQTASHLLSRVPILQNQHIMGWGAGNPEPSPGQYDWRDLDRRMKLMAKSEAIPVITLCCAPDWMKGGEEGRTNWNNNPIVAPRREHFDDYAKLAATVARRYPNVKHYMVWNEFKGFWNAQTNRWDAEGYTELYNKVYAALKKVDPDIKVGGPYVPLESTSKQTRSELAGPWGSIDQRALDAIRYWIQKKHGADFIVVDGASMTTDKDNVPDDFAAAGKFSAVTEWLKRESDDMPVWWAEWYNEPEKSGWNEKKRTAVQAATMMEFATSGVTTALYWSPQRPEKTCPGCLWTPEEGKELPMAGLISGFTRWFPSGIKLDTVTVSDPRVKAIAQPRQVVMVNTSNSGLTVTVDGKQYGMGPYEIRWSDRTGN